MEYFMLCRKVTVWIILGFFLTALSSCSGIRKEDGQKGEAIIGVKIYDYDKSYQDLFGEWLSLGINTALVSVPLLSDNAFQDLARKFGIRLFVIIPIFYDPEELTKNPELYAITDKGERAIEEWVHFVCPTREDYKKRKMEHIKTLIRDFNPDGISLDFIRYFVYWEKIYPGRDLGSIVHTCFDASCLGKFQNETKKNDPDVLVNIHTVPWRERDFGGAIKIVAGQDLAAMYEYADFFSPMCYSHMLKREPSWIHSVVQDVHKQAKGRVIPSIQVSKAYLEKEFTVEKFRDALVEALKYPSAGVIFWSWEALDKNREKKKAIREVKDKLPFWGGNEK
jgi:hypothetical protein